MQTGNKVTKQSIMSVTGEYIINLSEIMGSDIKRGWRNIEKYGEIFGWHISNFDPSSPLFNKGGNAEEWNVKANNDKYPLYQHLTGYMDLFIYPKTREKLLLTVFVYVHVLDLNIFQIVLEDGSNPWVSVFLWLLAWLLRQLGQSICYGVPDD